MSSLQNPSPFVPTGRVLALEAFERQDVGARPAPELDADAFAGDELTERENAEDAARLAAEVAQLQDATLIECVAMVDEGAAGRGWCYYLGLMTEDARQSYLAIAAAEVLRRLGTRPAMAA